MKQFPGEMKIFRLIEFDGEIYIYKNIGKGKTGWIDVRGGYLIIEFLGARMVRMEGTGLCERDGRFLGRANSIWPIETWNLVLVVLSCS